MSIMSNREREAENIIASFKEEFFRNFGIYPEVHFTLLAKENLRSTDSINLTVVEDFMNEMLVEMYPGKIFMYGIRTRRRFKELVTIRQIFFTICQEMGFGVEHLGNFLDYDHSTVTYAKKHVYELLESEDKETVMIYTHVKDGFKKRFSDYGDVFQDFRSRLNA